MSAAILADLAEFARAQARISWFAALGAPLDPAENAEAHDYLAALGMAEAHVRPCADWREAEATMHAPGYGAWWAAEERLRQALLAEGTRRLGADGLMQALTQVTNGASDVTLGAAAVAATRFGVSDPALARVAAGSAIEASYHAALVRAVGAAPGHAFAIKFRLFAAGHWPLGVADGVFRVF